MSMFYIVLWGNYLILQGRDPWRIQWWNELFWKKLTFSLLYLEFRTQFGIIQLRASGMQIHNHEFMDQMALAFTIFQCTIAQTKLTS